MLDATPLRSISLHEAVAERLRNAVFERQLAPGQWIDEAALCQAWQVSRTPLREALKVLAAEGLVELVPRRGCRVAALDETDARALFPVMALLEGRCAFEAAQNLGPADLADLRQLHDQLERHAAARQHEAYYRVNHLFHSRVQALAGNRWLDRATNDLRRFMRLLRGRQLMWPGRLERSLQEHRDLMDAFERRDAVGAERLMHDHLMAQLAALEQLLAAERTDASTPTRPDRPTPPPSTDRGPHGEPIQPAEVHHAR